MKEVMVCALAAVCFAAMLFYGVFTELCKEWKKSALSLLEQRVLH